ncbi:Mitochondrial import receptor subunit TOM20 [Platanthera zijinensis]|uniref:Mitochondrial import receptor subunit TOM20 n=1 Tax=Platanthera zijinensis TaxID=2320716 RepID=A0AAP0B554_9ASPA
MDMDLGQQDFDRILFYEHARKNAEAVYAKNPLDADNLTSWAGVLIELSQFQTRSDSIKFVKDAVSKLEEALEINPKKHDAIWSLGNAQTSLAFITEDLEDAKPYFTRAMQCFQQALEEDPDNQLYIKSLELASKAPDLHREFHRQMANQQAVAGGSSASNTKAPKKKKSADLKYDIFGWVILAVAIVAWVGMAKTHLPPPPPK